MWISLLAAVACLPCHQEIGESFAKTGMGRSLSRPSAEAQASQKGRAQGLDWEVRWQDGALLHRAGPTTRRMEWAVGSGHEGKSYLYRSGDALFQSPLSWFARRGAWDLSPGFAAGGPIGFNRPITPDCLFCHAGRATPIPGAVNRYAADPIPEPAITCERCHGDGTAHARSPRKDNIVQPARLTQVRRASVCEQCHLGGAARVPLPGRAFADFRPGMALEEVFSVYIHDVPRGFHVVSHAEQLARSRCAEASGERLWCGTCHDPHRKPADVAAWHRERCVTCHASVRPHGEDCAGCHMPRTQAVDGAHTAFTDHRIQIPGRRLPPAQPSGALRAWREPAPSVRDRGLGLAYAGSGQLDKAYALLRQAPQDPEVQAALGLMLLQSGRAALAVELLDRAARTEPGNATRHVNLGSALLAAGRREEARAAARRALALEPRLEEVYLLLARVEPARAAFWRAKFRRLLEPLPSP